MEITWYGHSCFRLTERSLATVVTDPYDSESTGYPALKLRGDIVTISHDSPSHNFVSAVKEKSHVITGPGEFEIGGVFVTGIQTNGHTKTTQTEIRNTLYLLDYNGITVLHLGGYEPCTHPNGGGSVGSHPYRPCTGGRWSWQFERCQGCGSRQLAGTQYCYPNALCHASHQTYTRPDTEISKGNGTAQGRPPSILKGFQPWFTSR